MPIEAVILAIGLLLAALCLWGGFRAARKRRLIADLPTSRTSGVFIGLVELKGTVESEQPLVSFLAEAPCVWYTWSIEEHWSRTVTEQYTDSQGKRQTRTRHESGWKRVADGHEQSLFYLRDDDGVIRINPAGAKVEPLEVFNATCGRGDPLYYGKGPSAAVSDSDHRRRFVEQALPLHAPLYVVGRARERSDIVAPEIAQAARTPLYLISTRSEAKVAGGLAWQFWLLGILGLIPAAGGWLLAGRAAHGVPAGPVALGLAVGGGYVGLWLLSWLWMAYNSLVGLRQRVRQAWSNVDIQLKRRNDLIPNLVRVVEGLRDYERTVQTELAALRSQLAATAPGQPGPDPAGCAVRLRTIVECYPELNGDEAFLSLQRSVVETEQRISLARGYFNEVATFYNTRLQTVPDRCVAALAGLRPQPLIAASDFERAVPAVNLAPVMTAQRESDTTGDTH
ncbi:MAG TPA: LemA family protein [Phycisphaerae bacterium]|nr:LemA family protein [Phycisphaerae bacterium]HPM23756.1 LemA family protein [Phycisphaerae bacterium]